MGHTLKTDQTKELHAWLMQKGFVLSNLGQRFADGTELARLLKMLYPRRVELHNYSSCSSTAAKLNNWNTLNFKILNKLQLKISKATMEELARGSNSAVEGLLFRIMSLEKANNEHAMKHSSLALRTLEPVKSTKELDVKASNYTGNANNAASSYKNDPPADEQKIIAELCKELQIDMPKAAF